MILDRLNITPSSVFIKSTQLEITVSAVFSWTTLISYTIFIITWFSSIKKFSNSLLTDHINLVVCIPGRRCKRLNCWWLQKCSNRNYYDVWNSGLLPSLMPTPRKVIHCMTFCLYRNRRFSSCPLIRKCGENKITTVHENSSHSFLTHFHMKKKKYECDFNTI